MDVFKWLSSKRSAVMPQRNGEEKGEYHDEDSGKVRSVSWQAGSTGFQ